MIPTSSPASLLGLCWASSHVWRREYSWPASQGGTPAAAGQAQCLGQEGSEGAGDRVMAVGSVDQPVSAHEDGSFECPSSTQEQQETTN